MVWALIAREDGASAEKGNSFTFTPCSHQLSQLHLSLLKEWLLREHDVLPRAFKSDVFEDSFALLRIHFADAKMASTGVDAGCYVYEPDTSNSSRSLSDDLPSPLSKERFDSFHELWHPAGQVLQEVLSEADADPVKQICEFLASTIPRDLDRIPTALITTATAGSLFSRIKAEAD